MKTTIMITTCGLLFTPLVYGQAKDDTGKPANTTPAAVANAAAAVGGIQPVPKPGAQPADPAAAGAGEEAPVVVDGNPIAEDDGGFLIKDASINDIFQLLAKRADKQYFHNNRLNTAEYKVTGHLNGDTAPLKQMEELAFQYGLSMYVKGNTVYAMLQEQLQSLPAKEWTYSLRYVRATDIEQIKTLLQPMLTPGRGIVNFEPKTNTIVVVDTMHHIEMVQALLEKIDKPKGQIVVETKILRVNNSIGSQSGFDWSSSLGASGVSLDVVRSLNNVFGLESQFTAKAISGGAAAGSTEEILADTGNLILTPFQLSGVLRALKDGNLVTQKSNPVVITEDNEKAVIALIDRVPIITSTVNNTGNGASTTTDEVRYKIDESDSTEPDKTREIGVTIAMTPSLLPDGTIRMNMRPRNAQIVENVEGPSGNIYPRVSEATIESIARIPDGHSLIIGGFYGSTDSNAKNKVPLLGNVPVLKFFFKSKQTSKERSSLVFVVTPTSYDPASARSNRNTSNRLRKQLEVERNLEPVEESAKRLDRKIYGSTHTKRKARYPQR